MEQAELTRIHPDDLDAARRYMRVDGLDDDEAVQAAVVAARSYLWDAGVDLPPRDTPRRALYDGVCHSLALSIYDRRDPTIVGAIVSTNPVLRSMLTQLKLTAPPVSKLDTGGAGEKGAGTNVHEDT